MSDLGNYYGSFETAEELEKNGNKLTAAKPVVRKNTGTDRGQNNRHL